MHLTGQQSVNKRDMKQLTIENFKAMLDNALKNIKEREDEFSKLDAVIGDGDHGQAIVTAMSAIVATAQKFPCRLCTGKSQSVLHGRIHFKEYFK